MLDLISWYVIELRRRVLPHLPGPEVEDICLEAETHLRESAREIQRDSNMDDGAAAKAAITAFGTPSVVAMTHVRESDRRLLGLSPIWFVLGGTVISTGCWDFHWLSLGGYWDNFGETWQNGLAGLVGILALTAMVMGCRRGARSYWLPILGSGVGIAAVLPVVLCTWMVSSPDLDQGISRLHLGRDTAVVQGMIGRLDRLNSYLKGGVAIFGGDRSPVHVPGIYQVVNAGNGIAGIGEYALSTPAPPDRQRDKFVVPGEMVCAMVDGRIYALRTTEDVGRAMMYWRRQGPKAIEEVEKQKAKLSELLALAQAAGRGRVLFWNPGVFGQAVCWTLAFLPVLLALELITRWTFRLKRTGVRALLA
jgi:hypothetical protein